MKAATTIMEPIFGEQALRPERRMTP